MRRIIAGSVRGRMAVSTAAVGKTYPATTYAVGREKVREFALATGETNALHLDPATAREAGYADVVAPPMFCVVYSSPAIAPVLFDPEVGIDFSMMVHGGQEFRWGPLVVAGAEVSTTVTVRGIEERAGRGFYTFESVSEDDAGNTVCVGTWTNIVRAA